MRILPKSISRKLFHAPIDDCFSNEYCIIEPTMTDLQPKQRIMEKNVSGGLRLDCVHPIRFGVVGMVYLIERIIVC